MTRTVLVAALAAGAWVTWAGAAAAEAPDPSAGPPAAIAPVPPADPGADPAHPTGPATPGSGPNAKPLNYAPAPPAGDSSGVYLPSVVGGYVRSSASCLLIGCDDGPAVSVGPSRPTGPAPTQPLTGPPTDSGAAGAER